MNHDMMSTASMAMSGMSPTGTAGMAMPSSTGAMSGGHGGMSMGGECRISVSAVRDVDQCLEKLMTADVVELVHS